jgi:phosphoserine phosphatase
MIAAQLALAALLAQGPVPEAQSACRPAPSGTRSALPRGGWSAEVHTALTALIAREGAAGARWDRCRRPLAILAWDGVIAAEDGLASAAVVVQAGAQAAARDALDRAEATVHTKSGTAADDAGAEALARAEQAQARATSLDEACARGARRACRDALVAAAAGLEPDTLAAVAPAPRLSADAVALVRALDASGFDVFVVGDAPEWWLERWMPLLGLSRERAIGLRVARDAEGRLSPSIRPPVPEDADLVIAARTRIAPGGRLPALVVGARAAHAALLGEAGLAVVIGRDGALGVKARAHDWLVQPALP